jgi:hypothetical protein
MLHCPGGSYVLTLTATTPRWELLSFAEALSLERSTVVSLPDPGTWDILASMSRRDLQHRFKTRDPSLDTFIHLPLDSAWSGRLHKQITAQGRRSCHLHPLWVKER